MSHVDHAHWIPGQILPHFDPSHLSVGQITRVKIFSLSLAILANKRALREGLRAGTTHIPVCMTLPHIYKVIYAEKLDF